MREPLPDPRRPAHVRGILSVVVVALSLAFLGCGEDPAPRGTAQLGPEAELERLPGGPRASATARLVRRDGRDRLELRIRGLGRPEGAYAVWLYSSAARARRLGRFTIGEIELDVPLPSDVERFRDLDVSVEPENDIANHSGKSILRVPLARMRP